MEASERLGWFLFGVSTPFVLLTLLLVALAILDARRGHGEHFRSPVRVSESDKSRRNEETEIQDPESA